jgi:ABC-type maltose transport system permease subunit
VGSVARTRRLLKWVGNGLLVLMLVWTLVPFYWMLTTSLKKDKEIYGFEATLIPRHPTLDAYRRLFAQTPFVKYCATHDHRRRPRWRRSSSVPRRLCAGPPAFPASDDRPRPRLRVPGPPRSSSSALRRNVTMRSPTPKG